MSASTPSGTVPTTSRVAGERTSKVWLVDGATHFPPIKSWSYDVILRPCPSRKLRRPRSSRRLLKPLCDDPSDLSPGGSNRDLERLESDGLLPTGGHEIDSGCPR